MFAGNSDAAAVTVESDAVIAALHCVTHQRTRREGHQPVRAAIEHGNRLTGLGAVEDQRIACDGTRENRAPDFS